MAQVAIVADDLTGALDAAARWAQFGVCTMVMLTHAPLPHMQALAVHTASRCATAEQAYHRAREAAQRLRDRWIYKKVDSTLRGNIGAEVEGLLDGLEMQRALLAPAFPAAGRTVDGGILRIHGVPLAETEFSQDSHWPARESYLPSLLARQTRRRVAHLPLEIVARGEDAIQQALRSCAAELVVADAVEIGHLNTLARAATHMPQPWLCCGSAGLAGGWLQALGFGASVAVPFRWASQVGPVLVVSGSRHPVTAHQLEQMEACRDVHLVRLAVDKREDRGPWSQARRMLSEGRHVALTTTFSRYQPGEEASAAALLAHATAWVCAKSNLLGLVLIGGDTADAVCAALGMAGMQVTGEVLPGIAAASGIGGQGDGLRIVTKAGGFGDELAIVDSIDFLQGLC